MKKAGYIQVKKGQIYYECHGKGVPIVVIHGGPGLTMNYLFPHLLGLETIGAIIFYDQRGTGKSKNCHISNDMINIEQFIEDLENIRKALNFKRFILLGHSFGGFLAMKYAIHYPKQVKGMILMSTLPANYDGQLSFAQSFNHRAMSCRQKLAPFEDIDQFNQLNLDEIHEIYKTIFSFYFYDSSKINELKLEFEECSIKNGFWIEKEMSKQSIFKENLNLFPALAKLDIPCLIIHGERDIIPLQTAKEIHTSLKKSKLIILEQCDHFPFIEKQQETLDAIDDFVKNI